MLHIHHLHGRMRISSSLFKKHPALSEEILRKIKPLAGVLSVARNPATGNLLVHYCPQIGDARRITLAVARKLNIANLVAFPVVSRKKSTAKGISLSASLAPLVSKVLVQSVAEQLASRIGGPVAVRLVKLLW